MLFEKFPVHLFNSLSKKKELFVPINAPNVGLYVCGPTVYGEPHLGHARGAISFDIIYRYLSYVGYKVRFVRNITDVGHLENDADVGEDKIAKKARLEEVEPMEIVQRYTLEYHNRMRDLNTKSPSIEPRASGHIQEQINVVQKIIDNGYAYESNGSIYFSIETYLEKGGKFGLLSGKVLEDLRSGSRDDLAGQSEKKNPEDFALWKKASPEHIMKWESPWSLGFPGWHLECTAMSTKYLGEKFDIHGGGSDLHFPHHEGEIAQNTGAFGCHPCNYWMHNNMLTIHGKKMGKSLGNYVNLSDTFSGENEVLDKSYSPMTIRFFMLQANYKSTLDFSNEALGAAEKGYSRLMNAHESLLKLEWSAGEVNADLNTELIALSEECFKKMSDDFNTPQAMAVLFEIVNKINSFENGQLAISSIEESTLNQIKETFEGMVFEVFGLKNENEGDSNKLDGVMDLLIDIRQGARKDKDFALSDKIRDDLNSIGILLKDSKDGTTYSIS